MRQSKASAKAIVRTTNGQGPDIGVPSTEVKTHRDSGCGVNHPLLWQLFFRCRRHPLENGTPKVFPRLLSRRGSGPHGRKSCGPVPCGSIVGFSRAAHAETQIKSIRSGQMLFSANPRMDDHCVTAEVREQHLLRDTWLLGTSTRRIRR